MRRDEVDPRRYARGGWSGGLRGACRGGISWWIPDSSEDTGRCQRRCHGRIDAAEAQQAVAVSGVVAERLHARFTLVVRPSGQQMRSIALRDANTTRLPAKPSSTCCESCHRATPIRGGLRPAPAHRFARAGCSSHGVDRFVGGPATKFCEVRRDVRVPQATSITERRVSLSSVVDDGHPQREPGGPALRAIGAMPGKRVPHTFDAGDNPCSQDDSWVARRPTPLPRVRARLCAP